MVDQNKKTRIDGKKIKALDVLDKHMSHRSSLKKGTVMSGSSGLNFSENTMLNPNNAESIYQRSPTPRRPHESNTIMQDYDNYSIIHHIGKSPVSSPIRKGVSFSDRIESSPASQHLGSSPVKPSSMTKPPSKSILKYTPLNTYKHEKSKLRKSPVKPSHLSIDPFSLDFWVEGEVRNLINSNNVAEFRKIIEGGLYVLNYGKSRDFEIYATFNNIIPSLNGVILNDIMNQKTEVIIDNLDPLMTISLTVMNKLQEALLLQKKKDPFKSRCYIQVVRFFSVLFSNFKITKFLDGNISLQLKFKEVLTYIVEALTHENTNKAMVIYPLTLLKEEKFGQFYSSDSQVKTLLNAVLQMKEIESTNVHCERLMVLKQFLQKYSKIMLENLVHWFPYEVLGRFLIEDRFTSTKIRACCNIIILDLLRKFISNQKLRSVMNEIEQMPLQSITEDSKCTKIENVDEIPKIKETALGESICLKLTYLIQKKSEFKLSMDCWLGMCGLLFNSPKHIPLLLKPVGTKWLAVNDVCYTSDATTARGVAIKNRRILNYMIISNLSTDMADELVAKLVEIVMKPFQIEDAQDLQENLVFAFNGILYLIFCDSKDMSPKRFGFLFRSILLPLFDKITDQNLLPSLRNQAQLILLRVLRSVSDEDSPSPRQTLGFQPLKALSTVGIDLIDFETANPVIIEDNWDSIMKLLEIILSWPDQDPQLSLAILLNCIKRVPENVNLKDSCNKSLDYTLKILNKGGVNKNSDTFKLLIGALAEKYELHVFSEDSIFLTDIIQMHALNTEQQFDSFKIILNQVKLHVKPLLVFGAFHSYENPLISNYIGNAVGSMLLPRTMSTLEYDNFLAVVNKTPIPEVIDNLFTWLRKTNNWGSIANRLNISSWDDHLFANFIHKWIHEQKGIWTQETINMIKDSLWKRPTAFRELSSFLIKSGQIEIIKDALHRNPNIIDDLSLLGDLPLLEILPISIIESSFEVISKYDDVIKTRLFVCASFHKRLDLIKLNFPLLKVLLLPTDDDVALNIDRSTIIDNILSEARNVEDWELFSLTIEVCFERKEIDKVAELFFDVHYFAKLNPGTLAMLINKCGKINGDLISFFKKSLLCKDPHYIITVLEELMNRQKYQVFSMLKEDILSFLFGTIQLLSDEDKSRITAIFPTIANYYVETNSKVILDTMKFIVSLMKDSQDKLFGSQLILTFLNHPDFKIVGNKTLMKKLNGYKASALKPSNLRKYQFIPPKELPSSSDTILTSNESLLKSDVEMKESNAAEIIKKSKKYSEAIPFTNDQKIKRNGFTLEGKVVSILDESMTLNGNLQAQKLENVLTKKHHSDSEDDKTSNTYENDRYKTNCATDGSTQSDKDSCTENKGEDFQLKLQKLETVESEQPSNKAVEIRGEEGAIKEEQNDKENDENRFANAMSTARNKSILPVKIPLFNPFNDMIKLEENHEISSLGEAVSPKRQLRTISEEASDLEDPTVEPHRKVRKVINALHELENNDFRIIPIEDKKLLRKTMLDFVLKLDE